MIPVLSAELARRLADDRDRQARERRRVATANSESGRPGQRERVEASLLLSRRRDQPTSRRWA